MENQSQSITKIATAMVKVQKIITNAKKDRENPFFKSQYADLNAVWEACRKPLTDNGLSVIQTSEPTDGSMIALRTTLLHESGEYLSGVLCLKPTKADPQQLGSAMTYARRYALSAIVGICSEDDDDGNAASVPAEHKIANPHPHIEGQGKLAPSKEAQIGIPQVIVGKISYYKQEGNRPASIALEGKKEYYQTFEAELQKTLQDHKNKNDNIEISFHSETKGGYTNNVIDGVSGYVEESPVE